MSLLEVITPFFPASYNYLRNVCVPKSVLRYPARPQRLDRPSGYTLAVLDISALTTQARTGSVTQLVIQVTRPSGLGDRDRHCEAT